ncbi:DNA-binding transcriptional ArsR family regulator [Neisseria sp. HSC-16F19]|nr:metalloregulator ArsR/SmtB family transcription factor [Neisseria sp. HSC-16F19]MCP2041579.1 DNA-binding transcriptional ArsR family regulator [Neisseria sp. HSC-16F19]
MTVNIDTFKALGNDTRYQILLWLKDPLTHFGADELHAEDLGFSGGVCVGAITEKSGLAQSVISGYLTSLRNANLIESQRIGKWTYYRFCKSGVQAFLADLHSDLADTRLAK